MGTRERALIQLDHLTLGPPGADGAFLLHDAFVVCERGLVTGPAGCGKSLLLSTIAGRHRAQAGVIHLDDRAPGLGTPSLVPPGAPILAHLRPPEAVKMLLVLDGFNAPAQSQVVEALRLAELPDRSLIRPSDELNYFGRLSIWLAYHRITQRRSLLIDELCDELMTGEAEDAARLLREVARLGSTVVFTSRDRNLASSCADVLFLFADSSLSPVRAPAPTSGMT
jgi:ABC-type cobalamin/Fe3+-siderophores transport system ATPase subunit